MRPSWVFNAVFTIRRREKGKMSGSSRILLEGKIALITGAGSGIGRTMAKLFSENGSKVIVVDVVADRVKQVVEEIGSKNAIGMTRDLSLKPEPEKMIDEALSTLGRIDILCNNAGIMDAVKPVAEVDDELWERVMNINLNAPFRASRRAIPAMLKQGGGVIINTASVAGIFGGRAGAAYTTSKHALIGLTRSIAAYYGDKGIRCNAMVLGAVSTQIGLGGNNPSQLGLATMQKTSSAMPRLADPMEIAKLALFLASDDSSYVNGSCIVIDKGWTVY